MSLWRGGRGFERSRPAPGCSASFRKELLRRIMGGGRADFGRCWCTTKNACLYPPKGLLDFSLSLPLPEPLPLREARVGQAAVPPPHRGRGLRSPATHDCRPTALLSASCGDSRAAASVLPMPASLAAWSVVRAPPPASPPPASPYILLSNGAS